MEKIKLENLTPYQQAIVSGIISLACAVQSAVNIRDKVAIEELKWLTDGIFERAERILTENQNNLQ